MAGLPPMAFCASVGCCARSFASAFTGEPSTAHTETLPSAPAGTPESARSHSDRPLVGTGAVATLTSGGGTYFAAGGAVVVVSGAGGGGALDVVAGVSALWQAAARSSKIAMRFMAISY